MTTHANFAGQLCVLLAFYCGAIWETGNGNLGTHSETNTSGSSCTFSTTNVRARCSLSRCLLDVFKYSLFYLKNKFILKEEDSED